VVCGHSIDGVRDRWIVEHIRALELGGADEFDNMGPAHETCGRLKTKDDHASAARAKRRKIRHLGAVVVDRPLPSSRTSELKRKINGTVVRRFVSKDVDCGQTQGSPAVSANATNSKSFNPDYAETSIRMHAMEAGKELPMANEPRPVRIRERVRPNSEASATGDIRPAVPAHLEFLFDDRPLVPGDNSEHYDAIRNSIIQQVKPADVVEAIWVKDIIDLIWEARRVRRWRNQTLVQARMKAVAELIRPAFERANPIFIDGITGPSADALAAGWAVGNASCTNQVENYLREQNLTAENITAHAFLMNLPAMERIDRLMSLADQRRDSLLHEIERKRTSLAEQLREASSAILDVEPT
jgi:hypothetical protein